MTQEPTGREVMPLTKQALEQVLPWAQQMAGAGFFKDVKNPAQALVKILAGREMGFGIVASLSGVHIIEGVPTLHARLQAAKVKGSGKYDYRIRAHTDAVCEIEFFELGPGGTRESLGTSIFTQEDAALAGLNEDRDEWEWFDAPNGGRRERRKTGRKVISNYNKFPRNMLFARAMTNGIGWYCPDVFDMAVYTPEEIRPDIELAEDGRVINVDGISVIPPERPQGQQGTQGGQQRRQQPEPAQPTGEAPAEAPAAAEGGEAPVFVNPGAVAKRAHDEYGLQPTAIAKILGGPLSAFAGREGEAWALIVADRTKDGEAPATPAAAPSGDPGELAEVAYPWRAELDEALAQWNITAEDVLAFASNQPAAPGEPSASIYARLAAVFEIENGPTATQLVTMAATHDPTEQAEATATTEATAAAPMPAELPDVRNGAAEPPEAAGEAHSASEGEQP